MTARISDHISYKEAVFSETAERHEIDNTPTDPELSNMRAVAKAVFEPIRCQAGIPIRINSFFRCAELNTLIGGSRSSQHCKGEAMDISSYKPEVFCNAEIFFFIKDNLDFDQIIWEYGDDAEPAWVHVSYRSDGHNRKQVLIKRKGQPYLPFNE